MMRSALLVAGLALTAASDTGSCALNGARAVDDLLDSATYIWASVQRCQKPAKAPAKGSGNEILCSMDVASAIEAVSAMINVVLKGVEQCGDLDGEHAKCGMAAGVLTKTFAGVAAASAGITAKCPNKLNNGKGLVFLVQQPKINQGNGALASAAQQASLAQCLVNVKDVTKSLFKATKRLIDIKHSCNGDDDRTCSQNALKVVAAFSAMGEYLAGAVGRCSANIVKNTAMKEDAECAGEALELVRHLTRMGSAGAALNEECFEGEERLYELEHGEGIEEKGSNSFTLVLGAFLPITAVLSFVGGSRFAKSRGGATMVQDTEVE